MTHYEAYIDTDWRDYGLAHLLVVRRRDHGSADLAVFLVDVWCLGIKDAYGEFDVTEAFVKELVEERLPEDQREAIHPTCAKKLIDGALAYAEQFGFAPHRDFRKARKVLSGLDASHCPTEFTYGRDGRPCFMRGPDDSDERVDRILAILTARCGEGGYDFMAASGMEAGEEDPVGDLRTALTEWFNDEPDEVPGFYCFSGMVTALLVCPGVVMPTKLMEKFWGPGGREWKDRAEGQYFASMLMSYWNYVGDLVQTVVAPEATIDDQMIDVWLDDFPEDGKISFLLATVEWAGGFMQATALWPEAWADALTRPDIAEHWEKVRWWAEFREPEQNGRLAKISVDNPPNLALSVQALARALRPRPPG